MTYNVILASTAEKELFSLPKSEIRKIITAIDDLQVNPRPKGYVKLRGHGHFYRIRKGNYRIIYIVDDEKKIVRVLFIRNRTDAYK